MSRFTFDRNRVICDGEHRLSQEQILYMLNQYARFVNEPMTKAARTCHELELASGAQLNEAMGDLMRQGKTDQKFREDVLHRYRMAHVIDPETGKVNHPLAINRRVQVGYEFGTIKGISTHVDNANEKKFTYDICFDSSRSFSQSIDQCWVWPLDENDQPMKGKPS